MKRFWKIFQYEFLHVVKGRGYRLITVLLMLALVALLSFPRFTQSDAPDAEAEAAQSAARLSAAFAPGDAGPEAAETALAFLTAQLPDSDIAVVEESEEALTQQVEQGTYAWAVSLRGEDNYLFLEAGADAYGAVQAQVQEALSQAMQARMMAAQGVTEAEAASILSATATGEARQLGADPMEHFLHTYVVIMLLYLAILLYGSMVSSGVAAEKTTRAMELLITSARPSQLMFGKVLGLGCAGLLQLLLVLVTGKIAFTVNSAYWVDNALVASVFDMPLSLLGYALLFFVLGFFVYAFLFGAAGSLVNRSEDLSSAIMPITLLYVAVFLVVIGGVSTGTVDGGTMRIASFIPFSSPMAMFARISMGHPAPWEILLSIAILIGSVLLIGYAAAGIYRLGVLLYGQKASPKALWQAIRRKNV